MKKNVLIFLQSGIGGAERVSVTIGKNLNREKFNVTFCCVGERNNSIERFIPPSFRIIYMDVKNPVMQIWLYIKKISEEKPDIVFASVININNKVLLSRLFFPKVRFVVRSDNNVNVFSRFQQMMIRFTYKFADCIIAQTIEMAEGLVEITKINRRKIVVLANPIDESYINDHMQNAVSPYEDNGNIHYVASGRFAESKGFDLLVKAFLIVHKKNPKTDLHILGKTGGMNNKVFRTVENFVRNNSLLNSVFFTGQLENPYPYIKFADCFVLSSRYEGLPNVLLESLYLQTPVAAFKCIPIIERLVQDGTNGYTANAENIESLAEAMENSCLLGRVINRYKSASAYEFEKLF